MDEVIHTCMHTYINTDSWMCVSIYACKHMHALAYLAIHICTYIQRDSCLIETCIHVYNYTHTNIHSYIHQCIHTHIHSYINTSIYIDSYACFTTCIHTYLH